MSLLRLIPVAALVACCASAIAQNPEGRFTIGASASIYFPGDRDIRDKFGDSIFGFSLRPTSEALPRTGRVLTEISVLNGRRDGSRFFVVPVTVGFGQTFASPGSDIRAYAQVGVGFAYTDYAIDYRGRRESSKRLTPAANLEVGVLVSRRLRVAATYHVLPNVGPFNFSGFDVSASYTIFRF